MSFEAKWAIIEAFIEDRAIDPDPDVVAAMREMVRYGGVPFFAGPGVGVPADDHLVAGPGLGVPAADDPDDMEVTATDPLTAGPGLGVPLLAGPGLGVPLVAGPGLGVPQSGPGFIVFETVEDAVSAHDSMEELAEEMTIEPVDD